MNAPRFHWDFDPVVANADGNGSDLMDAGQELSFAWEHESASILGQQAGFGDLSPSSKLTFSHEQRSSLGSVHDLVSSKEHNPGGQANNTVQPPQWTSQPPSLLVDELSLLQGDLGSLSSSPTNSVKTPVTDAGTPVCRCAATTFEILRTLHDRSSSLQTPFDTVLATNKDAVGRVSNLLSCTCTGDPTYILILAASITKMITWYQSICRVPAQSGSSPTTPPTTIIVGAYRLDGDDEDSVKTQVVLNELKRVDILMARFGDRFLAIKARQESAFYGELIMFLRRKLREVVGELQKDLNLNFADIV
ncbi:MAG: hypothetical protein Q9163_003867 [Psora crenata]